MQRTRQRKKFPREGEVNRNGLLLLSRACFHPPLLNVSADNSPGITGTQALSSGPDNSSYVMHLLKNGGRVLIAKSLRDSE